MKQIKTNKSQTNNAPANVPTATAGKFQTPHEQKAIAKAATPKGKDKAKKSTKGTAQPKKVGRDAFGGRIGTRMSEINLVVINSGKKGATVPEVAEETGETPGIVGAQLGWMVSHKKVATRKEETNGDGKKVFRYFPI